MIIVKPYSWLVENSPTIDTYLKLFNPIFELGGYVAGGFLRTSLASDTVTASKTGDIDFFFPFQEQALKAVQMVNTNGLGDSFLNLISYQIVNLAEPNSIGKFAYEWTLNPYKFSEKSPIRIQIIYKLLGTPGDIINNFDFTNCKIATDTRQVWLDSEFLDCESKSILKINNNKGSLLPWRIKKYITKNLNYRLDTKSKEILLEFILERLYNNKSWGSLKNPQNILRHIISHDGVVDIDKLSLFISKLGTTMDGDYSESSLAAENRNEVDFAIYTMQKRRKNE